MAEPAPSDNDLEQLFLQYLQELDRGETSGLDEFLSSRDLSEETTQQLRELIATEQIVQEMAGPSLEDEHASLPTESHVNVEAEETVLVNQQSTQQKTTELPLQRITLGDYEIIEELGRGGMGIVYKAHQTEMDRDVALKMIRGGCLASDEDVQRFYLEARAAGKLRHPAIVQVHQAGEIEGHHYFTMEYIEGDTLSHYVQREGLSHTQIAEMMIQVAEAVDFAHQHGLLHRDLKPSNVLVDARGNPRITDFGLAKDMTSGEQLTSSGSALGTPSYMPPEQAQALRDEMTCRSDVYSLGAILYALLTGRPPFKSDSLVETLTQVIHEEPVPPRDIDPNCPRGLEAICLKCLKKSSSDRYATAADLAEDLQRFVRGDRVRARQSYWYDRVWQWLRNVPMIAALLGRKSTSPTPAHVRFQWGAMILAISLVVGLMLIPWAIEARRFAVIDLSTGGATGSYHRIGQSIADSLNARLGKEVRVHTSAGAVESHNRLLSGDADIAFLQENALESEDLKVIAPLYREAVLVILRKNDKGQNNQGPKSIQELKGLKIALGKPGSGMRLSSRQLLRHYGLTEDDFKEVDRPYRELGASEDELAETGQERLDGAIVTIKPDNEGLQKLLANGQYRLLEFPPKSDIPGFRSMALVPDEFPVGVIPQEEMRVPATFAILAVREATPDRYVAEILQALYAEGGIADQNPSVYSLKQAADWKDLNYHESANRFFSQARQRMKSSAPP